MTVCLVRLRRVRLCIQIQLHHVGCRAKVDSVTYHHFIISDVYFLVTVQDTAIDSFSFAASLIERDDGWF